MSVGANLNQVEFDRDRLWCMALVATCDTDTIARVTAEFNRIRRDEEASPAPALVRFVPPGALVCSACGGEFPPDKVLGVPSGIYCVPCYDVAMAAARAALEAFRR